MYLLQAHHSNTDKLVASFVTTFFLIALYVFLRATSLPEVRLKTETYDEINWTRFKPKPKTIAEAPKPASPPKPMKMERPPQPKPTPVEKVDLSSLQNIKLGSLSNSRDNLQQKSMSQQSGPADKPEVKIDLKNSSVLSGSKSLLGDSSTRLQLPNQRGTGGGRNNSASMAVGASTTLGETAKKNYAGKAANLGAPETKNVQGREAQVAMKELADFGNAYSDLSPIYHELIEWMKRNPAAFPDVVKRFMEGSPGDLMSTVNFQIGGRQFQMWLLCKERLFEVRICLLEGGESTYLIDRGFKEKSSFLRFGGVNRDGSGNILSFETVREAASNARTQQFYQIFLSWWENVKSGGQ
ncbi:MAG TPA: hypothetical protein VGA99_14120 [bacterium]